MTMHTITISILGIMPPKIWVRVTCREMAAPLRLHGDEVVRAGLWSGPPAGRRPIDHDPEKACPGLDPGWIPVSEKHALGLDPGDHALTIR